MNSLAVLLILAGSLSKEMADADPNGTRFFCGRKWPAEMCLPMLRPECRLAFVRGASIPPEAEDHVLLQSGAQAQKVKGPDQLAGCVSIQSVQAAIDYLRFFSSYETVHMFEEQELEIFTKQDGVDCTGTCISLTLWKKLGLSAPTVVRHGNKFRITRLVIKPVPTPWLVSLYRVVDDVGAEGSVSRLSEHRVNVSADDLAELNFPMYL